jgi:beta-lactamase regulating signal transducer with metallopeptidase domain
MMGENAFLWSCVWQGTVCIGVGLVGCFVLRRRPARAHRVLLLAMIAAVIVPVMSALVNHFELGMFAAEPVVSEPVIEEAVETKYAAAVESVASANVESQIKVPEEAAGPAAIAKGESVGVVRPEKANLRLLTLAIWGWVAASLILCVRLLVTFVLGVRLLGRSAAVKCGRIQEAADAAVAKLGIGKAVVVRSSNKVRSPVIWCWSRRPVLLVSSSGGETNGSLDWVSIVCHELAHWKRRDHISGLLAELVVCVMPWNPLLWLAKRRLVRLSEQACDDWVVAAGRPSMDYAESLLDLAPQGQMAFAPAVLSSEKGLGARVRRILQDKCGNPRTGARWALVVSVVAACMAVGVAFAQTRPAKVRPATKPTAQPITGARLMDDRNVLEGLIPVIKLAVEGMVGKPIAERIPRLRSEPGPGVLRGIIKDSADTSEHMTRLFFVPVEQWPGEPLFYYLVNVNESLEVTGIPPGTYYLFSVEGNFDAVGLPADWPKPVKIRADGKAAHVEIESSAFLSKKARFWNVQGFLNGVGHLNAENVASEKLGPYGKVTDASGRPVPYAMVYVREFKPSGTKQRGIKTPDARTNAQGYYGLRPLSYNYYVGATTYESLKHLAGFRSQSLRRNKVFEGKQGVDFELGPWLPEKTVGGTIEATVVDGNGNPIPSFSVTVRPMEPWVHVDQTDEPWTKSWWLRAAFGGANSN